MTAPDPTDADPAHVDSSNVTPVDDCFALAVASPWSEGGDKLTGLLKEHIMIAADVVKAAKANQKDQVAEEQRRWSKNGQEIAAFLSGANPKWSKTALEDMFQKHLDLLTGQVVSRLQKDWKTDIEFYDRGHEHMLMFSDALTEGIVQQFPARFKK